MSEKVYLGVIVVLSFSVDWENDAIQLLRVPERTNLKMIGGMYQGHSRAIPLNMQGVTLRE